MKSNKLNLEGGNKSKGFPLGFSGSAFFSSTFFSTFFSAFFLGSYFFFSFFSGFYYFTSYYYYSKDTWLYPSRVHSFLVRWILPKCKTKMGWAVMCKNHLVRLANYFLASSSMMNLNTGIKVATTAISAIVIFYPTK